MSETLTLRKIGPDDAPVTSNDYWVEYELNDDKVGDFYRAVNQSQVTQEPKPAKINRLDPAWAQFGCACIQHLTAKHRDAQFTADDWRGIVDASATFADAMLRERDRRDREDGE